MPNIKTPKIAEPGTLAIVAAGATVVSAAFTTLGYFAQRAENRRITGLLIQIKEYLKELESKIDVIKKQNEQILKMLDNLPAIIARLLREETLNDKYNTITSIEYDYFLLPGGERRYLITAEGWNKLNEALTFVVKNEFRVSNAFNILKVCEFSLSATNLACSPIITVLIQEKISVYRIIKQELYEKVLITFNVLKIYFDNKEYILEHNFDENLNDLQLLKYTIQPDMATTESNNERVMLPQQHQEPRRYVNQTITRPNATGIAFNNAKASHVESINKVLIEFQERVNNYKEIRDIIKAFEFYLQIIDSDFSKQTIKQTLAATDFGSIGIFNPVN